eukprot:COSAG05_NODE_3931_length_1769_cov_1.156287_1_plen_151_part_00
MPTTLTQYQGSDWVTGLAMLLVEAVMPLTVIVLFFLDKSCKAFVRSCSVVPVVLPCVFAGVGGDGGGGDCAGTGAGAGAGEGVVVDGDGGGGGGPAAVGGDGGGGGGPFVVDGGGGGGGGGGPVVTGGGGGGGGGDSCTLMWNVTVLLSV